MLLSFSKFQSAREICQLTVFTIPPLFSAGFPGPWVRNACVPDPLCPLPDQAGALCCAGVDTKVQREDRTSLRPHGQRAAQPRLELAPLPPCVAEPGPGEGAHSWAQADQGQHPNAATH